MRIWACATVLWVTATAARADDLIASGSTADHAMVVERVSATGLELVYQEPLFDSAGTLGALSWAWSDRGTLWVLRKEGTRLFVAKVVDLVAEPAREATLADFRLRREPKPVFGSPEDHYNAPSSDGTITPTLLVTASGQVWLERCLEYRSGGTCKMGYLRVDRPGRWPAPTTTPPAAGRPEPALPAIAAAPQGYSAALKAVKARGFTFHGAECTGPHGNSDSLNLYDVWPAPNADMLPPRELARKAEVRVVKIEWVRAEPPIVRYTIARGRQTWTEHVKDCQYTASPPYPLEDGRWLDGATVRRADGSEIGTLRGGEGSVAPGS